MVFAVGGQIRQKDANGICSAVGQFRAVGDKSNRTQDAVGGGVTCPIGLGMCEVLRAKENEQCVNDRFHGSGDLRLKNRLARGGIGT